ncbi:hypothetical protein [Labrenzia sp. OB1]|uniref:hypothetical protein n=1 Tax=Labrenzia sp. OB1 TaxID=1561204 RepID=UPI0007B2DAA0|nr:hypothetical protein [Labrenzia sp. OB1]KZM50559.1 hypothetical protein OA90_08970 [Labrenzia sp. OB1]
MSENRMSPRINEERGARRAEELRRRFRHVSDTSFRRASVGRAHSSGRLYFGQKPAATAPSWGEVKARRPHLDNFLIWCVLAVVVAIAGFAVF